jgi:hypothetical protein
MPQKEGYYWAKGKDSAVWNLIIYVYGSTPFFRLDSIDIYKSKYNTDVDPNTIIEFGPEIKKPTE